MTSCAWLATQMDQHMLGSKIADSLVPESKLAVKTGEEVFTELGGRMLLRYVEAHAVHEPSQGRPVKTFVTPTPYGAEDVSHHLDLPRPDRLRGYVIRLDPRRIRSIAGPQWIGLGMGVQYVLMYGYPADAVLPPGWAHEIR